MLFPGLPKAVHLLRVIRIFFSICRSAPHWLAEQDALSEIMPATRLMGLANVSGAAPQDPAQ